MGSKENFLITLQKPFKTYHHINFMQTSIKRFKVRLTELILNLDYLFFKSNKFLRKKIDISKINRILIVELTDIGDLISITPAIKSLRIKFLKAKIDILVKQSMKDLLKNNPNLNEIISFDNNILEKIKDKYDLAVVLRPGSFKISRLMLKANIPYRIGPRKTGILEGKGFFFNLKPKPTKLQHVVYDNLDVVNLIGAKNENPELELYTDQESIDDINKLLKDNKTLIAIHPGSKNIQNLKNPSHLWPSENWAFLADELVKKYDATIIITGTKEENFLAEEIKSLMKNKPLILTELNLNQLKALIKKIDLLISMDTGPVHIAVALNKPVISLMGPQLPEIWRPFNKRGIVIYHNEICTGCQRLVCKKQQDCMKAIKPEEIIEKVKTIL